MNVWLLWILAAVVCGIIEVMSVSFVFLMFAIGALAAGVAAALGASVFVQVIVLRSSPWPFWPSCAPFSRDASTAPEAM